MSWRAADSAMDEAGDWPHQQRAWMQALLEPRDAMPWAGWSGGVRQSATAGAVYVNNVRANVIAALSLSYPATRACLGQRRFDRLVVEGLSSHPPFSGDLNQYGGWLPDALAESLQRTPAPVGSTDGARDADMAWLARLEWALDQARCTGGDQPIAWTWTDAARDMQREDWPCARTRLRGPWQVWSLSPERNALLAQAGPLLRAHWPDAHAVQAQAADPADAAPAPPAQALLQLGSDLLPMAAPDLAWLMALDCGATFASATEQTLAAWPQWTPARILDRCLNDALLAPPHFRSMPATS